MKIERRKFPKHLRKMRRRDKVVTMETILKFGFENDVDVILDDGSKITTSPMMANRIRKRHEHNT